MFGTYEVQVLLKNNFILSNEVKPSNSQDFVYIVRVLSGCKEHVKMLKIH